MSGKDDPVGWGLSSEQYDDDKTLEVDSRSADYDEVRKRAKDPHATWSQGSDDEPDDSTHDDDSDTDEAEGREG